MRAFSFHPTPGSASGSLALLLLGLLVVVSSGAAAQFPGELHGRAVDAVTGEGVTGARASVTGTGIAARGEGDGSFRLRGLEEGTVRVTVTAPGFLPETRDVEIRHGVVTREVFLLEARLVELDEMGVPVLPGEGIRLDREAISLSGARTVGELLEGVPGVVLRRHGSGGAEEVSLRGAGSARVLVLLDGVPLNDPMTGSADLSSVPVATVTTVEILPGARGARYGAGALGGVIRIVSETGARGGEGSVRAGSLGVLGADGSLAGRLGPVAGEAHLQVHRIDGEFPFEHDELLGGGKDRRRNGDLRQGSLHLGVASSAPEGGRWQLRASVDGLSRGIPGKSYAPSPTARQTRDRASVQGRWEREGSDLPLAVRGHHVHQQVRFRDPAPPLGPPFDTRSRLRASGLEAELLPRAGRLRMGGGLSLRHQLVDSDRLRDDGRDRRTDVAAHVHAEAPEFAVPGRPSLGVALRVHRDGGGGDWLLAHDLTLRVSLGALRLHASHRSSFSPPGPGDQFFREGVGVAPNPDLKAERVPGELEVGAALRLGRGPVSGSVEGELFRGDLRDMIVWAPDFRFVWSPRNVDVRRRGGELRGQIRHGPSGFRLGGHVSRTRVTYVRAGRDSGVQVIYRPRDTGGLLAGLEPGPFRLEVRAAHTGVRYPVAASVNALDPFWTVSAVVSGEWILAGWRVRPLIRVDRLLDETDPFIYAFPEPGRTLRLELRLSPRRFTSPLH